MADDAWWRSGVIYQIYPRSFQDANRDGVGDIPGVRRRLDYLKWLGVDALWLSPVHPSPMADFGYDIRDYRDVDPVFGSLADLKGLVEDAHRLGLKVILDYVPNHTSDQHPWFIESRASRLSPKRDWYIWRDAAADGGPPNNWISLFGGPAWQWDAATSQYYYHAFLPEQPDLNWRNPEVKREMLDVLRYWLDFGVDGFRIDALWALIEDEQLRDNPPNPDWRPGKPESARQLHRYNGDLPEVHAAVAEMRAMLDAYSNRVLIAELYLPFDRLALYYGSDARGAHLPFNFHLISTEWRADALAKLIKDYEASLPSGAWPNWVLGNHDKRRVASRLGESKARLAAMALLTLRGTPILYYGDELAIPDGSIPPELARDPVERCDPGHGRDPARTPMAWDASANAGFTTGSPWLPIHGDCASRNVAAMREDSLSILNLYRRLIALRRERKTLQVGAYTRIACKGGCLVFERAVQGDRPIIVALNLGDKTARLEAPSGSRILLSSFLDREEESLSGALRLRAAEGVLLSSPE